MNPNEIIEFQERLDSYDSHIEEIEKSLAGMKIDYQVHLKANKDIVPGIACKIAYDSKGLIVGAQELIVSDIPNLPIEKIIGLDERLADVAEKMNSIQTTAKAFEKWMSIGPIVQSGIKVNYDEHGRIVSSANLLAEDIPELPMSKIVGLEDALELIRSSAATPTIQPQIIKESKPVRITMDDMPSELFSRLNEIETRFSAYTPARIIENVNKTLRDKVDANPPIRAGKYTKVQVDAKGLVTHGDQLEKSDLPDLGISDITGLTRVLQSKADRSDLNDIQASISQLMDTSKKIGDVLKISSQLSTKADDSELKSLAVQVSRIKRATESLTEMASGEMIMEELRKIRSELSILEGRVSVLESSKSASLDTSI